MEILEASLSEVFSLYQKIEQFKTQLVDITHSFTISVPNTYITSEVLLVDFIYCLDKLVILNEVIDHKHSIGEELTMYSKFPVLLFSYSSYHFILFKHPL